MAIRIHSLESTATRSSRTGVADRLAALPGGSTVGIYENRIDAIATAIQITLDSPDTKVWVASGDEAAREIRAARGARSMFSKLAGGLSDDQAFVDRIVARACEGSAILVIQADSRDCLTRLAGASHLVEFGRWTTRELR